MLNIYNKCTENVLAQKKIQKLVDVNQAGMSFYTLLDVRNCVSMSSNKLLNRSLHNFTLAPMYVVVKDIISIDDESANINEQ